MTTRTSSPGKRRGHNHQQRQVEHVDDWAELRFDEDFHIGLVLGASSSGKTQVLRHFFGEPTWPDWNHQMAVVSQFADPATGKFDCKGAADEAQDRLSSVGLGSIPTWMRPYTCLSNGEQARSRLARQMTDGAVIDDFTSVVNRQAAWAMSSSVSRFIRRRNFQRCARVRLNLANASAFCTYSRLTQLQFDVQSCVCLLLWGRGSMAAARLGPGSQW